MRRSVTRAGAPGKVKPGERPVQDLAWTLAASERVSALLRQVLPPLCSHPRAAVRAAIPCCRVHQITLHRPCLDCTIYQRYTVGRIGC